jgi:hypothetical protein
MGMVRREIGMHSPMREYQQRISASPFNIPRHKNVRPKAKGMALVLDAIGFFFLRTRRARNVHFVHIGNVTHTREPEHIIDLLYDLVELKVHTLQFLLQGIDAAR